MGNANTENKKARKRAVQAREFLKTRIWGQFQDLTPLDTQEVLLVKGFFQSYLYRASNRR